VISNIAFIGKAWHARVPETVHGTATQGCLPTCMKELHTRRLQLASEQSAYPTGTNATYLLPEPAYQADWLYLYHGKAPAGSAAVHCLYCQSLSIYSY